MATNAQLKQLVRHAVELAVQEIVAAVIERSIKIAITTAEHIIKKDFALDPDESRMRVATHHMVRNLTAAMAMITCRDYLATNITKSIKQGLMQAFSRVSDFVLDLTHVQSTYVIPVGFIMCKREKK